MGLPAATPAGPFCVVGKVGFPREVEARGLTNLNLTRVTSSP